MKIDVKDLKINKAYVFELNDKTSGVKHIYVAVLKRHAHSMSYFFHGNVYKNKVSGQSKFVSNFEVGINFMNARDTWQFQGELDEVL